jgi:hypothetical protein
MPIAVSVARPATPFAIGAAQGAALRLQDKGKRRRNIVRITWFALLLSSVCLEGLGRRYLRQIPTEALYFSKDIVLAIGLITFGIHPEIKEFARKLYGKALFPFGLAVLWTILESFNPLQGSFVLALIGLRAYWLWWFAPLVIASVLQAIEVRRGAVYVFAGVAGIVCFFAVLQFGSPPADDVNTYSVNLEGDVVQAVAIGSTGRARVASTFSFITGFSDFTIIVPALLLTIGLGDADRKVRLVALIAGFLTAAVLPMSGSRAPLLIGGGLVIIIAWSAGFLFTRAGRRVVFGAFAFVAATTTVFPEALEGVYERMAGEDSNHRVDETLSILPPVSMQTYVYPAMGIGTGMQQNARSQLGISAHGYDAENEPGKHLIELGIPGYLLFWFARLGISLALFKASRILRKARRGAAAGAAVGFSALTFLGNLTFDHIWQALFFIAVGYILLETFLAYRSLASSRLPVPVAPRLGVIPPHRSRAAQP